MDRRTTGDEEITQLSSLVGFVYQT